MKYHLDRKETVTSGGGGVPGWREVRAVHRPPGGRERSFFFQGRVICLHIGLPDFRFRV